MLRFENAHPSNGTVAPDGSKGREASDETVMISNLVLKLRRGFNSYNFRATTTSQVSSVQDVISGVPMKHNANEKNDRFKVSEAMTIYDIIWKTFVRPGFKSRRCPVGL